MLEILNALDCILRDWFELRAWLVIDIVRERWRAFFFEFHCLDVWVELAVRLADLWGMMFGGFFYCWSSRLSHAIWDMRRLLIDSPTRNSLFVFVEIRLIVRWTWVYYIFLLVYFIFEFCLWSYTFSKCFTNGSSFSLWINAFHID